MIIDTFLYYTLFASIIFIYGIGIHSVIEIGITKIKEVTFFIKVLISIFTSSVLSWIVTAYILQPLNITELFPLVAFLIFVCINTFLEAIIQITTGHSSSEFMISYLIVLLSIMESTSLVYTMIICSSCLFAFGLLVPFCYTFKNRIQNDGYTINRKYYCFFLIFLGVLILALSSWDIFWLTPGVIK